MLKANQEITIQTSRIFYRSHPYHLLCRDTRATVRSEVADTAPPVVTPELNKSPTQTRKPQ